MNHIVLFEPEIPQNTGNIIRTAASFNAKVHIIRPMGFSMDERSLKRAGMDYIDLSVIHFYDSLDEMIKDIYPHPLFILSRYGKKSLYQIEASDVSEDYYFLFGRESSGLPKNFLLEHINETYRVPMRPEARSLNLSNTVAIAIYEGIRQQGFFSLASQEEIKGNDFIGKKHE